MKMRMKWSPWPATRTRKFQVRVKPMRLEGFDAGDDGKVMAVRMKWKGEVQKFGLVRFYRTSSKQRNCTREKIFRNGEVIEWNEEFKNLCCFSMASGGEQFVPWDVSFNLLYGVCKEKLAVIGKVSINLAEMAIKMESQVERKIPINVQVTGLATEAALSVFIRFVEIRNSQDSVGVGLVQHSLSEEELSLGTDSDESVTSQLEGGQETSSDTQVDQVKKIVFFSSKRRLLSFRPSRSNVESLAKKTGDEDNNIHFNLQLQSTLDQKLDANEPSAQSESKYLHKGSIKGDWKMKELDSRDGHTKLKASVFFASFDQRNGKAAGESACTALVAVIAHWLQSNQDVMPTRSEFDGLIIEGSSEWRKLCKNEAYANNFPDKHFDLDTVLRADVRPIAVLPQKSFVGFFGADKFESLKGAMSFDELWNEISNNVEENEPRIYILSWNDHFFVLKTDSNAYYIIDTLGERLFEGCNQAYILRFDESALIHERTKKEKFSIGSESMNLEEQSDEIICRGKECCAEFMKRFLAVIQLRELEEEEKNEAVSYYSLHQRLQIEFNYSYSLCMSSSSSSPFSSSATSSTSSQFFSNERCI